MRWRLYPAREHLEQFARDWDRVNHELYSAHPLFSSAYQLPLLRHYGDANTVLAVLDSSAGPAGFLILQRSKLVVWHLFVPVVAQVAPLLLSQENYSHARTLFRSLPGYPIMFDWLCQDPLYSVDVGKQLRHQISPQAVTMAVEYGGSFDEYWGGRSKSLRKNIGKYLGKLSQLESYRFVELTAAEDVMRGVDRYGVLESKGWKGKAGTALNPTNLQGRFFADLLREFAGRGDAAVFELWVNEDLIASRLVISGGGMSVILKTTYDESKAALAPGRVLLHEVLRRGFESKKLARTEFYTDATVDQLQWATSQRVIQNVTCFRNALWYELMMRYYKVRNLLVRARRSGAESLPAVSSS